MTYELCDIIMISSICSLCSFIGGIWVTCLMLKNKIK